MNEQRPKTPPAHVIGHPDRPKPPPTDVTYGMTDSDRRPKPSDSGGNVYGLNDSDRRLMKITDLVIGTIVLVVLAVTLYAVLTGRVW